MSRIADQLSPAQLELMEQAARVFQRLGVPRSTGQIYGLLFSSHRALSLDDIAEALTLSKTSASTGTRQLLGLNLVRQVWLPGERRDYFEARTDLSEVFRANFHTLVKPRLEEAERRLQAIGEQLEADRESGRLSVEAHEAARGRLAQLLNLQKKLNHLLPLADKLL